MAGSWTLPPKLGRESKQNFGERSEGQLEVDLRLVEAVDTDVRRLELLSQPL